MCKLRGELEGAMSEVTSLRKHREAQENIIQTLSGQREEMKRLYLEAREKSRAKDKEPERDSALGASPSLSAANSSDTQNMVLSPLSFTFPTPSFQSSQGRQKGSGKHGQFEAYSASHPFLYGLISLLCSHKFVLSQRLVRLRGSRRS